ncbi:PDZ_CTP_protease and SacI domain-containing protein [Guillardia theta CCMP2712]|uniref:PDZ_CTP_protease and SacI domain-containing protein n=1 Tax=Guillardia theta (strain CCMP2712) TaxID=905079 RepID=L1JPC6_GUITC|nr:PDZ_CTP_protease and SacI domain-containing protein [Guillardia theta CCMP2712]EKX50055.1 PDZ_CTP_protease and SacI domain-containing protein [Guillardia theta CCMP2712]|eukprot:XP_005837035.1 PDZ_CTP_protease and SacI domain-containing protein [Guillardia theta CCMP2712]
MSEEKIVGVGIVFDEKEGGTPLRIESLVPGSGADACGELKQGDELLTIDGIEVEGKSAADLAKYFQGPAGSTVILTLRRKESEDEEKDANLEDEVVVVEVPRIEFSINDAQFVPWINFQPSDSEGSRSRFSEGIRKGADRLWAGVAPLQGSLMKQMKNLQTSVQNNAIFENISNRAIMVKQVATSAALPVLKNIQKELAPQVDPKPKDYCMYLYTFPDKFVIMPPVLPTPSSGAAKREAVLIDRSSIEISSLAVEEAESMVRGKAKAEIMGILGIANLMHASYLILCTGRQMVASMHCGVIYKVSSSSVRVLAKKSDPNPLELSNRAIEYKLLEELLDTFNMFFSYDWDVTQTQQRLAEKFRSNFHQSYNGTYEERENRFIWNHNILKPFSALHHTDCLLPVVSGFVGFRSIPLSSDETASLLVIGRRDWRRSGYRYLSRGVDADGHVSNSVETEQIISPWTSATMDSAQDAAGPSDRETSVSSFVIVRGSIPLIWTEADAFLNLKHKPKELSGQYGKLAILSLVEQKDSSHERPLGLAYERMVQEAKKELEGDIVFIPFDFHNICGKLAFRNLPLLVNECSSQLESHGFCLLKVRDGGLREDRQQGGVMRVNCVDCLDRTNVAQSVLSFHIAMKQLAAIGAISMEDSDACLAAVATETKLPFPWAEQMSKQFKALWADHGDFISVQYSGTAALKGDLTRTGKRTVGGLFQDGVLSIKRCVQNNFADFHRQQVIEGFHGILSSPDSEPVTPTGGDAKDGAGPELGLTGGAVSI